MEIANGTVSSVLLQRRYRISKKTYKKILIILLSGELFFVIYGLAFYYQTLRYRDPGFNCIQFTEEAKGFFEFLGFKTYKCIGVYKTHRNYSHEWLGVDMFGNILHYDHQNLFFFNPSDAFKKVIVREWQ